MGKRKILARKDNIQSVCSILTICTKVEIKTVLIVPEVLLSGFSSLVSDLRVRENPKPAHNSIPDGPYPHKAIMVVNLNRQGVSKAYLFNSNAYSGSSSAWLWVYFILFFIRYTGLN